MSVEFLALAFIILGSAGLGLIGGYLAGCVLTQKKCEQHKLAAEALRNRNRDLINTNARQSQYISDLHNRLATKEATKVVQLSSYRKK